MLNSDFDIVPYETADSAWKRSFSLSDIKCLVVCRGPVRKEAFDVFEEPPARNGGDDESESESEGESESARGGDDAAKEEL